MAPRVSRSVRFHALAPPPPPLLLLLAAGAAPTPLGDALLKPFSAFERLFASRGDDGDGEVEVAGDAAAAKTAAPLHANAFAHEKPPLPAGAPAPAPPAAAPIHGAAGEGDVVHFAGAPLRPGPDVTNALGVHAKQPAFPHVAGGQEQRRVCCFMGDAAQQERCRNTPVDPESFDQCVGAVGRDCDGVEENVAVPLLGEQKVALIRVHPASDGDPNKRGLFTAPDAVAHDLCCAKYRHGTFCTSDNYPIAATFRDVHGYDNSCACLPEWRGSVHAVLYNHGAVIDWDVRPHTFDASPVPPDTQPATRPMAFPNGLPALNWGPYHNRHGWEETRGTRSVALPSNTVLDCPVTDARCRIPGHRGLRDARACAPENPDCSAEEKRLWQPQMAHAGEGLFCRDPRGFKSVLNTVIMGPWTGTCW